MKAHDFDSFSLIVPCFNEASGLESLHAALMPVLRELAQTVSVQLVLVDDGSTDRTFARMTDLFVKEDPIEVTLRLHSKNRGLSRAIVSGAEVARGDVIGTMDSDCSYDPAYIRVMLDVLERTQADIVTASPYHPDGGIQDVDGWRILLSKGATSLYSAFLPEKLFCYTSMFRVYRREWLRAEWMQSANFVGVTEVLAHAMWAGARVVECPAVLRPRTTGVSKMHTVRNTRQHLRLMAQLFAQYRWRHHPGLSGP